MCGSLNQLPFSSAFLSEIMFVFFSRVQLQQEKSSSLLVLYHFVDSLNADPIMMIRRLTAQVSYGFCFWALILDTRLVILWCF